MREWEKETDPIKKKRLAKQIQNQVGVKADGVIGRKTMQAVQQAGGMPPPVSGGNQAGTSVVDFGGSQFKDGSQGQQAQGGFFSNLFAPRPAQPANPALGNMMREWELEPDPNKKRMIAMEIQKDLGVKADGVIGNQTMQAIQKAGGMSGGGMNPGGGGMHHGAGMHHGGGMNPGGGMHHGAGMHHGGVMHHGGGMNPGGGGMHHGAGMHHGGVMHHGGGMNPGGGGMNHGSGGGPGPGGGGGPGPGGGGGPKN